MQFANAISKLIMYIFFVNIAISLFEEDLRNRWCLRRAGLATRREIQTSNNLSCETVLRNGNHSHISEIARSPRCFGNVNSPMRVST